MATAPAHVAGPTYNLQSTFTFSSFDSKWLHSKGVSAYSSLRLHSSGRVRAALEGESSSSQHTESINRPVLRRKRPAGSPTKPSAESDESVSLQTVLVEEDGVSLEGVGRVDREVASTSFSWRCFQCLLVFVSQSILTNLMNSLH